MMSPNATNTHEFGHPGINVMVYAIQHKGFTWPKIMEDCQFWAGRCAPCQQFNIARKGYHPLQVSMQKSLENMMLLNAPSLNFVEEKTNML